MFLKMLVIATVLLSSVANFSPTLGISADTPNPEFLVVARDFEYFMPEAPSGIFRKVHKELTTTVLSIAFAEIGVPPIVTAAAVGKLYETDKSPRDAIYGFTTLALENSDYVYCKELVA